MEPSLNGAIVTLYGVMSSKNLTLKYKDLSRDFTRVYDGNSDYEFTEQIAEHVEFGNYRERSLSIGDVRINTIRTDFIHNCQVEVEDENLEKSLHLCMPLHGTVSGQFYEASITSKLHPNNHHYVYLPGSTYELKFDQSVNLAHIEFGLSYFDRVLCPSERWSSELKEKLFRKEVVYSGGGLNCHATREIVQSILNCALAGSLRKMFIEAKVLELITIQLEHYSKKGLHLGHSLKKNDRQLMEEVYRYLEDTFQKEHSLHSLSREFGINEFKLKRDFKVQFNKTIFEVLFDLKMNHAKRLLLDSNLQVGEVSRSVGYKNANHFSTAFTKRFGINPSSIRI